MYDVVHSGIERISSRGEEAGAATMLDIGIVAHDGAEKWVIPQVRIIAVTAITSISTRALRGSSDTPITSTGKLSIFFDNV